MNAHCEVIENENEYEVVMVRNERIVQVLIRTNNRQKAYRVAEKWNGKTRNMERSNKNIARNM